MGVPAFYRWLSQRYPKIVVDCVEEEPELVGTVELPVDITRSNPNGVEFNNLYLDMNGIIHPCFHPEDKPAPSTEKEVFANIFEYIDRLVAISRPRSLIYMAIDGVAPRAKMNQQRSRRFRAAQDREEQQKVEAKLREKYAEQGIFLPEPKEGETFDSNVITPGTEFMDRLAIVLQWYVHQRLNFHPGWRNLTVVLSDANTPGEGEHKFSQFIREQRARPGWNPNTWHCVYGLDADLIHLALATHEPHYYILREVVFFQDKRGVRRGCGDGNNGVNGSQQEPGGASQKPSIAKKPYQFLKIDTLREYLTLEFQDLRLPFEFNPERVIDDFVFMCFFVGNDFLPHMPTLDIREEGIELMLHVYREVLPQLPGYVVSGAHLHLDRIERFIQVVGAYEDKIFQARARKLNADKRRQSERRYQESFRQTMQGVIDTPSKVEDAVKEEPEEKTPAAEPVNGKSRNRAAAEQLKERLLKRRQRESEDGEAQAGADSAPAACKTEDLPAPPTKKSKVKIEEVVDDSKYKADLKEILKSKTDQFDSMVSGEEAVRLGEEGWKQRYYEQKFGISDPEDQAQLIADLKRSYVEGLCWVMRYYFDGVASWRWFYPFHYAPFASDLTGIADMKIDFELGEPFEPYNQLMGVLPAASKHALPVPLRHLFDSESSCILDFYPTDFQVDMNGKRFAWQGVALLPFIDEQRLLDATGPIIASLPPEDRRRNERRLSMLFARASTPNGRAILEQATEAKRDRVPDDKLHERVATLPTAESHVAGQIFPCKGDACPHMLPIPPFARGIGEDITGNQVAVATFKDPPHQVHKTWPMPGTILSAPSLSTMDVPLQGTLWCMQHDKRMAQRNGQLPADRRDYDRRDYRHGVVGQAPPLRVSQPRRLPDDFVQGGPPAQRAYYSGAPFSVHPPPAALMQPMQQFAAPMMHVQPGLPYIMAGPLPVPGYSMTGAGATQGMVMQSSSVYGVQTAVQGAPPGQVGSFFAQMRPPVAHGPGWGVGAPGGYVPPRGAPGGRGGHAMPPDVQQNRFQALRDQRHWRQ